MGSVHLIHIRDKDARKRAIEAFLNVRETWLSFPGNLLGVSSDHIEALKKAQIPFEDASQNGQAPVQS